MRELTMKKRVGRQLTPVLRVIFRVFQLMGFHIVRNHFYEPVPDTRFLKEDLWLNNSGLAGVEINDQNQLKLLKEVIAKYVGECDFSESKKQEQYEFHLSNGLFESLDAEVLYCFVRNFKPQKVIEIGSGYSTYLSASAALMNRKKDRVNTEVISIEPYPNKILSKGFPGLKQLICKKVEEVDIQFFQELNENDILFIDTSHVVKIGNDVLYIYLQILPLLKKGVIIHIHDIFLPAHYPKQWVIGRHVFWTEQYLLQAFLSFNNSFEVVWASSYMSMKYQDILEEIFVSWKGSYKRLSQKDRREILTRDGKNVWPVSFWLRKLR